MEIKKGSFFFRYLKPKSPTEPPNLAKLLRNYKNINKSRNRAKGERQNKMKKTERKKSEKNSFENHLNYSEIISL